MIDACALALGIRTVSTLFLVKAHNALIGSYAESFEPLDNFGNTVFNFALFVGIFDSEHKNSVGHLGVEL